MSWDPSVFGGLLRCTECGREQPLGDATSHLRTGWPMCCSYTMRWLTQRELDAEHNDGCLTESGGTLSPEHSDGCSEVPDGN